MGSTPTVLQRAPMPSSAGVSRRMSQVRTRDTKPEQDLRAALHARGLRFRLGRRPLPYTRFQPDITFPGPKVAVFVDGCFWHGCLEHKGSPKANRAWWRAKIERNRQRDEAVNHAFTAEGWHVIRIWEHDAASEAADRIEKIVRSRQNGRFHG